MYSDEIKAKEGTNNVEIDLHPISKWKRTLLYLADFFVSFIVAVLLMNVAVMPICSLIKSTDSEKSYEAEKIRDDILYEHKLLFYRPLGESQYQKYNFDTNLTYTFNRFLAYYVFDSGIESLDPDFPEYSHLEENETILHYYKDIKNDVDSYYELFKQHNLDKEYFDVTDNVFTLSNEVKEQVRVYFIPGEELGSLGKTYYSNLSDFFSALFGCVIQDINQNDLIDSSGNSYNACQKIISDINKQYYMTISVCAIISYVLSWGITRLLYPLINKSGHSVGMSIMRIERLGYRNLMPLSKGEVALTASYSLLFDLPYITLLSLSYCDFIYSLNIPLLPILSLISLVMVLISLFVMLFSNFNRAISDYLSQTVLVSSEDCDALIKAKETLQELKTLEKKGKING